MDMITVMNRIGLPDEAKKRAVELRERIGDDVLSRLEQVYLTSDDVRSDLFDIADSLKVSRYLLALLGALKTASYTFETMLKQGMTEDDIILSLRDITIWCKVCKRDFDEWGLHEISWIKRTLRAELWRLGRLQFEYEIFDYDDVTLPGREVIRRGDKVINVHIPEDGPIPKEERMNSYKKARSFLGLNKFFLDSYLLYPRQRDFLPPKSNILSLMDDYYIFRSGECDDYRDMWRLFGRRDKWEPAELPRDTGLLRAYADHLAATGKCGWGIGIMILND